MDLSALAVRYPDPCMLESAIVYRYAAGVSEKCILVDGMDNGMVDLRKCFKFYSDGVWNNMPGCGIDGTSTQNAALNCKAIKKDFPASPDGVYWLDIDGCGGTFAPAQAYCDMTTDGGGWTQVLNYNHALNTDPSLKIMPRGIFPLLGSMVTGVDESASPTTWGHASISTLRVLAFREVRFFGHGDYQGGHTISFKTSLASVVTYIKNGTGSMAGIANASNYTHIQGTLPSISGIPGGATSSWGNRGEYAMTDWCFWRPNAYGWAIKGNDPPFQKWVAGEYVQNPAVVPATHHIIWVR